MRSLIFKTCSSIYVFSIFNKKIVLKHFYILLMTHCLLAAYPALAQQDWHYLYQEQEGRAERLFEHYYSRGSYREALPHLEWLLDHKDQAEYHRRAVVVYEYLHQQAKEETDQDRYARLSLRQFDLLKRYEDDTIGLLNRKLQQSYRLFYDQPAQYAFLLRLSEEALNSSKSRFAPYNFTPLVRLLLLMIRSGSTTEVTLAEGLQELEAITLAHPDESDYQEAMEKVRTIVANNQ